MSARKAEGPFYRFQAERFAYNPTLVRSRLTDYLHQLPDTLPGKTSSIQAIEALASPPFNMIERMADIERHGKHGLLSHSISMAQRVGKMATQLNMFSEQQFGRPIVDTSIAVTAAFLHDGTKVMWEDRQPVSAEVEELGLHTVDVSDYTTPLIRNKDPRESHMVAVIALLRSLGPQFEDLASASAHSIHHIKGPLPIPIERLLVMFADFTSEGPQPTRSTNFVQFMSEKLSLVKRKYPAPNDADYNNFFNLLFSLGILMEQTGIDTGVPVKRHTGRRSHRQEAFRNLTDYLGAQGIQTLSVERDDIRETRQAPAELLTII